MTDGGMWYTADGKVMKRFGPDDSDGLKLLRKFFPDWTVDFITADFRGWAITSARIEVDMGCRLWLMREDERVDLFKKQWPTCHRDTIFIGDGMFDAPILQMCLYGIAPRDAAPVAIAVADWITECKGGNRAVAEACLHIMERAKEMDW